MSDIRIDAANLRSDGSGKSKEWGDACEHSEAVEGRVQSYEVGRMESVDADSGGCQTAF